MIKDFIKRKFKLQTKTIKLINLKIKTITYLLIQSY